MSGLIVIADSALKPFSLARDIEYLRDGQSQSVHRQGEIWFQERQQPRPATAEEIAQSSGMQHWSSRLDSARKAHGLLGKSEQIPDPSAWDRLIAPERLRNSQRSSQTLGCNRRSPSGFGGWRKASVILRSPSAYLVGFPPRIFGGFMSAR